MLHDEDRQGADFHAFVGRDLYVWNNAEGDCSGLWSPAAQRFIDKACYDPHPPEGAILVRVGDKLVPSRSHAWR